MKRTLAAVLLILSCLFPSAASVLFAAEGGSAPVSQKDKESYSIGYEVGLSMKADGVEVNFEKLVQGLQDAINDKKAQLGSDEMKKLIVGLKKKARETQTRAIQAQNAKNAEASRTFFEENKKREGIMTTESGLQYRVLQEGSGASPKSEDFVKVNYRGTFLDGKEFDNSYAKGEPLRIQMDRVIKGWKEALPMMKVGSRWQLFVPPELGYGDRSYGPIQPNSALIFEVELISVGDG
jgi:FKBP-type peptidyl-prolyl cis-trans isomerase